MLASVRSAAEACEALSAGAHIIDAKEPRAGALGALPLPVIAAIVAAVGARAPVSATVGDLPLDSTALAPAMLAVAAAGVDFVKIGVFGSPGPAGLAARLSSLPAYLPNGRQGALRVAVLMADQGGADESLAPFAQSGFAAVMIDTADKTGGGLRAVLPAARLAAFVAEARALGLGAGLAGSLALHDIEPLAALRPHYLGFRTALCQRGLRAGVLDYAACLEVLRRVAGAGAGQETPGAAPQFALSPAPPIC